MIIGKMKDKAWEKATEVLKDFLVSAIEATRSIAKEVPKDAVDLEVSFELPEAAPLPRINFTVKLDLRKI